MPDKETIESFNALCKVLTRLKAAENQNARVVNDLVSVRNCIEKCSKEDARLFVVGLIRYYRGEGP